MKTVKVLIDWDENYGAVSEAMSGCVATAKTVEAVKEAYTSALNFHLDGMKKDGDDIRIFLKENINWNLNYLPRRYSIKLMVCLRVQRSPGSLVLTKNCWATI